MRFNTTIARREAIAFDQTELNNDTTTQDVPPLLQVQLRQDFFYFAIEQLQQQWYVFSWAASD